MLEATDVCRRKWEGGELSEASPEDYVEMGGKYIQKQSWRRGRMQLTSRIWKS